MILNAPNNFSYNKVTFSFYLFLNESVKLYGLSYLISFVFFTLPHTWKNQNALRSEEMCKAKQSKAKQVKSQSLWPPSRVPVLPQLLKELGFMSYAAF